MRRVEEKPQLRRKRHSALRSTAGASIIRQPFFIPKCLNVKCQMSSSLVLLFITLWRNTLLVRNLMCFVPVNNHQIFYVTQKVCYNCPQCPKVNTKNTDASNLPVFRQSNCALCSASCRPLLCQISTGREAAGSVTGPRCQPPRHAAEVTGSLGTARALSGPVWSLKVTCQR